MGHSTNSRLVSTRKIQEPSIARNNLAPKLPQIRCSVQYFRTSLEPGLGLSGSGSGWELGESGRKT
ncbi:hypothetical protein D3C76_1790600 [compost metagenome]